MSQNYLFVYTIWLTSEILINRLYRKGGGEFANHDKGSLKLIWSAVVVAVSCSIFISANFNFPINASERVSQSGLILILSGCILRFYAIRELGKEFTTTVKISSTHKLKMNGLYGVIRHPSYLFSLLSFAGFGISLNNWASLIALIALMFPAFLYRIKIEESVLIDRFGNEYLNYRKRTWMLIPFLL